MFLILLARDVRNIIFALFFAWPVARFLNLDVSSSRDLFLFFTLVAESCAGNHFLLNSIPEMADKNVIVVAVNNTRSKSYRTIGRTRSSWAKFLYLGGDRKSLIMSLQYPHKYFKNLCRHSSTSSPSCLSSYIQPPIQPCYNTVYPAFLPTSNHATTPPPSCISLTMKRLHLIFLHPSP